MGWTIEPKAHAAWTPFELQTTQFWPSFGVLSRHLLRLLGMRKQTPR